MSQSCGPSCHQSTTSSLHQQQQPPQTQRSWFGPESPNGGGASRKKRPRPPPPPLSTRLNHMMLSTSNSTYSHNAQPLHSSVPPINPYHVLQIRRDATNAEIRDAYRRLALWHHPGRGKCLGLDEEELQRRFAIFDMVAACYETLMDRESRYACDQLIKRLEVSRIAQHLPMAGELHVGGQRFWTGPAIQLQQPSFPKTNSQDKQQQPPHESDADGMPSLSRVSSHSSTDEQPELDGPQGSESNCNPSFLDKLMPPCGSRKESSRQSKDDYEEEDEDDFDAPSVSTSSTTTMDVIHYSESETNRLFGGSLALLHQARQWKPFTDPHEVFEQVFGAHMFPIQRFPRTQYNNTPPMTPASPTRNGSSRVLNDGTRISTSSRIIQHRQLTRIEKVVTTPQGQRQLVISVSSEDHSGNPTNPTNSNYYSPKGVDPKRPLMVAVSSSDEEQTNFFCLSQDWLNLCPFGGESSC